jgi:hypothetical protein
VVYNPQSSVFHTTYYDANLLKRNVENLGEQTDDRSMQSNGIASFILAKQTFNYTDPKTKQTPYLDKLFESYRMEDEIESIFYSRENQEVANGGRVVQNTIV